ncbi:unnamed protein product [Spirodela intermedia]|uniref:BTB domain-containing protein n=1 Tax=Spirodela intermedia TaxID=51605 RepID=A0A7I8JA42_SPIIN|nr:unnamed protein product [Spirodela intermedia]CAA6666964.1 unnamed protein product [Spirodela intermedia]
MSPPPPPIDRIRSSPTLFEMMANEQDCHPRNQIPPLPALPAPPGPGRQQQQHHHPQLMTAPPLSAQERQLLLQERVAEILGSCSPGSQLGDQETGDVRLTLTSRDGLTVSMAVHRQVLVAHSRFFAAKLSDRWAKQQPPPGHRSAAATAAAPHHVIEISDCDDVEVYVETLRLMYCQDLRRRLMREDVPKVLAILKVSSAIGFDGGILSCLEYLEAAPWAEDEEEKVAALLSQLRLENSGAGEVLKRVSLEVVPLAADERGTAGTGGEEVLVRLLQVVLEGKDEKARREMKRLVSKMLRENNSGCGGGAAGHGGHGGGDLSKESLYAACESSLRQLRHHFLRVAGSDLAEAAQISRQADNLHWLLDILVDRQMAEELLQIWAAQAELAAAHPRVPAIHRYEVSRVTARCWWEARCQLLQTWLEPFYEDFGWMRRACKGLDRHLVEDGLANTILTLPLGLQQEILLSWFDRFLNSGDDCPNIQRGFEVWWRRAFWRRNGDPDRPPRQLRIVAATSP